ncbi:hypothetical protein [Actinoplanes friuliensis]|uniref:Lipoprotein n=1 Tax=Actinoplanes friuliensis DSM 7358 TaxID=1246995 RepID=U5VNY1_9ACTN|nr:hypothetical protein [Actinoplanes friuliensis]AGZ38648.1 hypothetical protein AFR_01795 [Actinoplanes friuliensis DSM 7358]
MIAFPRTAPATLLVLGFLTACSGPAVTPGTSVPVTPSGVTPSAAPSSTEPTPVPSGPYNSVPTGAPPSKPAGIPKTPTDNIPAGWTEGTVTRGGTGPCYGLVTFDGVPYAMYSDAGVTLTKGDHIKARLTPAKLRINCGEGTPVAMGAVQHFP